MESGQIAIKLRFKGEIHRVRVQLNSFNLASLNELFKSTYEKLPEGFVVQYKDNEGDICTLSSDLEFMEACRVFLRLNGDSKTMSFFATSPNNLMDRVTPVIKAVEEFAVTVSNAAQELVQKAREKEWAERARIHAEQTGQAIHKGAVQTGEYIQTGAKETGDFFQENIDKFNETEFARKMKDIIEEVRQTTLEFVEQVRNSEASTPIGTEVNVEEPTVAPVPSPEPVVAETEAPVEPKVEETTVEPLVEEVAVEQIVQEETPAPAPQAVEEAIEVKEEVEAQQNSDAETSSGEEWDMIVPPMPVSGSQDLRQWSEEYKVIREMFPEVTYEKCEELLTRFDGNLHVVLNALMDL